MAAPDSGDDESTSARSVETVPVPAPTGPLDGALASGGGERYELGAAIGSGGMGEVLLARDAQIGREVAIKRVRDQASRARFLREARIQGRLDHPAIVPVHELGIDASGRPYFVMKRLTGVTLRAVLTRIAAGDAAALERWPRQRLLRAFADVCLAVEFAHSRGVIHRDLKPDNVMLGDFGEVWLLDWGVARVVGDREVDTPPSVAGTAPDATHEGTLLGTPGYASPEQLAGDPSIDHRTDVFALGCVLFEILAGTHLLPRTRDAVALRTFDARPSRRAPDRDIAPELDALCEAATLPDRHRRLGSARLLGEQVQRYLDGDRDVSLRRRLAAEHLEAARDALAAADTPDGRATAMREAGRALALDPGATGAADLVTRLMLAPPREVPPEVERELASIDDNTAVTQNRLAVVAFFAYLAFLPGLAWLDASWPWIAAIGAMAVVSGAIAWLGVRNQASDTPVMWVLSLLLNVALIATLSRLATPFLVAPCLAAATTLGYAINPREGKTWVLVGAMIAAVLGPWALEHAGVLARTIHAVDGALVLQSPSLQARVPDTEIALAVFVVVVLINVGVSVRSVARAQHAARRVQQLQAWHLRKLVP